MDPLSVVFGAVFVGFPTGFLFERLLLPWIAHLWAGYLRSHVRVR